MRAPPPLRWFCAPSVAWRSFEAGIAAIAAGAVAAWVADWVEIGPAWSVLAVLTLAVSAGGCAWSLVVPRAGVLTWTGRGWTWQGAESVTEQPLECVSLAIDLSSTLLLELVPQRPDAGARRQVSTWVAVHRAHEPTRWPALCALLYDPAARTGVRPRDA